MRYILRPFSILLIFPLLLTACRYEDGPAFSLRSAKARICQNWKIEKYYINGADSTGHFQNDALYCADYSFYEEFNEGWFAAKKCNNPNFPNVMSGNWKLESFGNSISFALDTYYGYYPTEHVFTTQGLWNIRRLTKNEFWVNRTFNNKEYEIHFKAL